MGSSMAATQGTQNEGESLQFTPLMEQLPGSRQGGEEGTCRVFP